METTEKSHAELSDELKGNLCVEESMIPVAFLFNLRDGNIKSENGVKRAESQRPLRSTEKIKTEKRKQENFQSELGCEETIENNRNFYQKMSHKKAKNEFHLFFFTKIKICVEINEKKNTKSYQNDRLETSTNHSQLLEKICRMKKFDPGKIERHKRTLNSMSLLKQKQRTSH